jgi:hypothetical protein
VIPDFLFSANDELLLTDAASDGEEASDVQNPVEAFFKTAELGALLNLGPSGHRLVHNLQVAAQERDAALASHYKKIAADAAKKEPQRLEKGARRVVAGDANDARKVARTETTKYSSGKTLIAEIDATGEVIRVLEEAA